MQRKKQSSSNIVKRTRTLKINWFLNIKNFHIKENFMLLLIVDHCQFFFFDCFNNLGAGKRTLVTALENIDRHQLRLTGMNIIRGLLKKNAKYLLYGPFFDGCSDMKELSLSLYDLSNDLFEKTLSKYCSCTKRQDDMMIA